MSNIENKKVAAVSAVMEYLRKEDEILRDEDTTSVEVYQMQNLWGIGGRQAQMNLRTMMQLKGFHGWRIR